MKKLQIKFNNAFTFLYTLLFAVTPLLMYHKTSEIFEFNKMLFIYLITLLILSLWLVRMIIYKKVIFKNTILTIPLMLFLVSQIISTYYSIDRHTSIFGYYGRFNGGLLSIVSYVLLYFGLVSNVDFSDRLKKVLYFVKVSLVGSVFVILWGLPSKFGFDLTCWAFTGSTDVSCWSNEFVPTSRIFSTLGQPNWLGAYLVVNFFLALYLYISQSIQRKWLIYAYLFLNFLSILFTRSRSAFLGLGIGLVLIAAYYYWTYLHKKPKDELRNFAKKLLVPIFMIVIVALGISYSINNNSTNEAVVGTQENTHEIITDSFEIRKLVWQGGYSVGLRNFWNGTGVETFAYAYNFLRPAEHNMTSEWDFVYNKAHNEFINYFTTTGLLGVVAYMLVIAVVISRIRVLLLKDEKDLKLFGVFFLAAYASLIVSNFFGFSTTMINVYFYLIPAFLIVLTSPAYKMKADEPTSFVLFQKAAFVIPALLVLYGISYISVYFVADVHYARGENYRLTQEYDQALFYLYYADSLKKEHVYKDKISQVLAQKGFFDSLTTSERDPLCPTEDGNTKPCFDLSNAYIDTSLGISTANVYYHRTKARNNYLKYQATGDEKYFDAAVASISKAQELAPTDPRYPYMKSLFFLGRYDNVENPTEVDYDSLKFRAAGPVTTAIKLKSNYKDAYITRAIIFTELDEREAAAADYTYILENIDPSDGQAKQELERLQQL